MKYYDIVSAHSTAQLVIAVNKYLEENPHFKPEGGAHNANGSHNANGYWTQVLVSPTLLEQRDMKINEILS
jgi:hypothetical protein